MAASSLAFKNLASRSLLSRSLRSVRPLTPPAVPIRFFSTTVTRGYDSDDSNSDDGRFADPLVYSPFYGNMFHPSSTMKTDMISDCVRETWDSMETDDGLYLRVDMPGVGKESVKVLVEKEGTLVMEGEGKKDFKDDEFGPRYTNSIQLPQTALLNTKAIKAEMVNGVLKLFVPKLKVEERTDVLLVSVD